MTASDAKAIADEINQDNVDKADGHFDHVQIEIGESAKRGEYSLDYVFVPDVEYSLVNEIGNRLAGAGYDLEITRGDNGGECFVLNIDWSKNTENSVHFARLSQMKGPPILRCGGPNRRLNWQL